MALLLLGDNGKLWIYQVWLKSPSPPMPRQPLVLLVATSSNQASFPACRSGRGASNEVQLTDALARQIGKVPFKGYGFRVNDLTVDQKLVFAGECCLAMSRDDLADQLHNWLVVDFKFLAIEIAAILNSKVAS